MLQGSVQFLAPGTDEHHHVEHLAGVRCIAGRQNHFDDQDAAGRCHGASAVAQDCQALASVQS